ncbi:hypothetical protein DL96DRAFT_1814195 [Flagelloscypha sp. PMI_526]|nr:hypothetical protein DL96DRAFT_1814195 [Flagelloscypha sp. PMI_526]
MEATHGLPLDILRLLFEFSASASITSAKALSLVSKEVQHWADPHLFEIVQETDDNYANKSKSSLLSQMFMSNASPRIVLARNYVRVIRWDKHLQQSYLEQALETLPNLIQIGLWKHIFPFHSEDSFNQSFEITQSYPSLRRIAAYINDRSGIPPDGFSSPFWMTITHLQLMCISGISSSKSAFQLPLFVPMTSLTHLALSSVGPWIESESDDGLAFSRVRETFPPSLILCLLGLRQSWIVEFRHQLVDMTDEYLNSDERIVMWWTDPLYDVDETVVVNRTDSFEGSCRIQGGMPTFWEMDAMDTVHSLPLDILRLVFELSASTSVESAQVLSLVSKEVQRWTDPHLFQIVRKAGHNSFEISKTSLLEQMCMPDASPRIIVARNYVRSLVLDKFASKGSHFPEQALEIFPNLTQVCVWGNIFPLKGMGSLSQNFEITQSYPCLRRIATCLDSQANVPPNAFGSPSWMNITHLQVRSYRPISSDGSAFQLPLFISMTSLTHLALSRMIDKEEYNADLAFSRVRKTFPPSLILCLLDLMPSGTLAINHWYRDMTNRCLKVDERIVMWWTGPKYDVGEMVARTHNSFQDWCRVQDGEQTFWEMGEAVLKRRRERL